MRLTRNFNTHIVNFDEEPVRITADPQIAKVINLAMKDVPEESKDIIFKNLDEMFGKPSTLGDLCQQALLTDDEKGDQERVRRFELARRIHKGMKKEGQVEFNTEERDLLKKVIGKRFTGCLVPPICWELLEESTKVEKDG